VRPFNTAAVGKPDELKSGELRRCPQLCRNALTWAKTLAKDDKFMHQPDNPFGENLFSMWSSNAVTAKDAICNWYKEGKTYDYGREPRTLKSGNVTTTDVARRRYCRLESAG